MRVRSESWLMRWIKKYAGNEKLKGLGTKLKNSELNQSQATIKAYEKQASAKASSTAIQDADAIEGEANEVMTQGSGSSF